MAVLVAAALLVASLIVVEIILRRIGLGAFPLFEAAAIGEYRVRANQSGRFLRRHEWRYDANGMRNDVVPSDLARSSLLVGDSIVDGGVRIDQGQTLGALTTRLSGESFYAVGCHGWSFANSLDAVMALPGWNRARRLVFVLNPGDFDKVGYRVNELSFPTRRPLWLTGWLVRRQLYRRYARYFRSPEAERALSRYVGGGEWRAVIVARFRQLLADYPGPITLVRYRLRGQTSFTEPLFEELAALDPRIRIVEGADAPGWSDDCYVDIIHPNARGLEILAQHICRELR